MIWTFIIVVIGFILIKFLLSLNKDNYDLQNQTLTEKFKVVVNMINDYAYNGAGSITILDKRSFNLYQDGKNQIINFQYGTGILTITWKYKYFQKEVIHEKQFNDVRNISIFEQQKIAEIMISEMEKIILFHKNDVMNNI